MVKTTLLLSLSLSLPTALAAQTPPQSGQSISLPTPTIQAPTQSIPGDDSDRRTHVPMQVSAGPDYRVGPDDQLSISVLQAPELSTTVRVSQQGVIALPLLGTMTAGGLTTMELKRSIEDQLARKYIKQPDVTVLVTDAKSHSVSIVGAVQHPGMVQILGPATLLDVISLAGGLANDAGDTVVVEHKGVNGGAASTQELKIKPLMDSHDTALNIPIVPGDVVKVRSADVVYVVGAVNKPGSYAMQGNERVTVLRALALGGGLAPSAAKGQAMVVRAGANGERVQIPVNLGDVLKGKKSDVALQSHDLLFVPLSNPKVAARQLLDAVEHIVVYRPILP